MLSIGSLPSGCDVLYYWFDIQLFLQPHLLSHRVRSISIIKNSPRPRTYSSHEISLAA